MRIFVDTEFTDFIDCNLISVALVADDGREFYAECNDFDRRACNAFVHEAVLPQLGQYPDRVFSRRNFQLALHEWLRPFKSGIFCMDYAGDWDLLVDIAQRASSTLTIYRFSPSNFCHCSRWRRQWESPLAKRQAGPGDMASRSSQDHQSTVDGSTGSTGHLQQKCPVMLRTIS
ncbi:hypothetical protein [Burkholderia stagnalis]|uniref:hypothetical protein n=1 Tax=Burkholderia stagnalis TaxID=1503054 RepID=UPI000A8A52EB|nr:hypothetical protein [Burkholderia stagnalis]